MFAGCDDEVIDMKPCLLCIGFAVLAGAPVFAQGRAAAERVVVGSMFVLEPGVPVRDAYPLPAAVLPPGFQIVFSRFGGRLSAVLVFAEVVLDEREAARLAEALKAELLADGPTNGGS